MEINVQNNLNTSNIEVESKNSSPYSSSTSLFNKLISQIGEKETESSVQGLGEKVQDAISKISNDVLSTSTRKSNTHDELTLMLSLRNMQAS